MNINEIKVDKVLEKAKPHCDYIIQPYVNNSVKVNAFDVLKKELKTIKPKHLFFPLEPYPEAEIIYQLTENCLNLFSEIKPKVTMETNRFLVTKNQPILRELNAEIIIHFNFTNNRVNQRFFPESDLIERKLNDMEELKGENIKTRAVIKVFPFLTDLRLLKKKLKYADQITFNYFNKKDWKKFKPIIDKYYPDLIEEYENRLNKDYYLKEIEHIKKTYKIKLESDKI